MKDVHILYRKDGSRRRREAGMGIRYVRRNVPDRRRKLHNHKEPSQDSRLELKGRSESEDHGCNVDDSRYGLALILDNRRDLPCRTHNEERSHKNKNVSKRVHLAKLGGDQEKHRGEAQEKEPGTKEDRSHDNALGVAKFQGLPKPFGTGHVRVGLLRGPGKKPGDLPLNVFHLIGEIEHHLIRSYPCRMLS